MMSTMIPRSPGPRVRKRRKTRVRARFLAAVSGLIIIPLFLLAAGRGVVFVSEIITGGGTAARGVAFDKKGVGPLLVLDDDSGDLFVLVYTAEGEASAVRVPSNVITDASQARPETIGSLVDVGMRAVISGAEDVLGIDIPHYLVLRDDRLDEVTELDQLRLAAGRASLTNLSFGERRKLISWINATDTDVLPTYSLPVRPLKLGRRTYLEPKIRDVGSLIGDLWSVKSTARVSVIVLNGAGNPGVARALAGKLEDMNYNVIAVKNAESFDYAESRVLVYGQPGAAEEIVETMGVGAVAQARFRPKSIDLAVVVGKDYDPRP